MFLYGIRFVLLGIDETTRTCAGSEFWMTDPRTGAEPRDGE